MKKFTLKKPDVFIIVLDQNYLLSQCSYNRQWNPRLYFVLKVLGCGFQCTVIMKMVRKTL